MSHENFLEAENIHKIYMSPNSEQPPVHALRGVSLTVVEHEFIAIVGPSGSGKSTLLYIFGTLDKPSSGTVRLAGKDPFSGSDKDICAFRNKHIGFVFQNNNLIPELSALENVMLPALIAKEKKQTAKKQALNLLEQLGLAHRSSHLPKQLSAGEQQRVSVARALVNQPALLLADEPSGNLDSVNAQLVHQTFFDMQRLYGTTVVVVTHNPSFAAQVPRCISFCDGVIVS